MKITGVEVLEMLCPQGGWIILGDDFEGITWVDDKPRCTKQQFDAGFAKYETWKLELEKASQAKRKAAEDKLAALGLTTDDLKALGLA